MPQVELLWQPSMAPPMTGSTCAYLSLFGLGAGPSCLSEKPGGEPSGRDIAGEFAGTWPTLQRRCSLDYSSMSMVSYHSCYAPTG
jgi:hypothetical protein